MCGFLADWIRWNLSLIEGRLLMQLEANRERVGEALLEE
jgi:hypothetical protein